MKFKINKQKALIKKLIDFMVLIRFIA